MIKTILLLVLSLTLVPNEVVPIDWAGHMLNRKVKGGMKI